MLSFTLNRSSITLLFNGDVHSIDESHINYTSIRDELKKPVSERDVDQIIEWASVKRAVEIMTEGRVTVTDNEIKFDGKPVHNYMTKRMMDLLLDGFDLTPWAKFMNNVYDNPAAYAHDELYEWMEKADMPLTDDGHFLAFKKVRANFTDCHTGKFDNSPGTVIEMPREMCDPVRSNHCSTGFHFCSVGYLSSFSGQRVVIVKINPRDVTSIPNDYGFTKGRCCRYEVVAELAKESAAHDKVWKKGVVNLENPAEFPDDVLAQIKLPTPVTCDAAAAETEEQMTDADKADDTGYSDTISAIAQAEVEAREKPNIADATVQQIEAASKGVHSGEVTRRLLEERLEARGGVDDATSAYEKLDKANEEAVSPDGEMETLIRNRAHAISAEIYEEKRREKMQREAAQARVEYKLPDNEGEIFETKDGRKFTGKEIEEALEEASAIRAAARELDIGESTLRGWKKKLGL
jgi:hypothetical protein